MYFRLLRCLAITIVIPSFINFANLSILSIYRTQSLLLDRFLFGPLTSTLRIKLPSSRYTWPFQLFCLKATMNVTFFVRFF